MSSERDFIKTNKESKIKGLNKEDESVKMKKESKFKETKISGEDIFKGRVLHVVRDEVMLPDGTRSVREYCQHVGAVCVIPILHSGEVLMERQYRYAAGRELLEIPAGKLDSRDEAPLSAAARELREETGAVAKKYTYIGKMLGSPAILSEVVHMYIAEDLSFGERELDEGELLEVEKIPLDELYRMVMAGEIEDSKSQIAILKAYNIKNGKV